MPGSILFYLIISIMIKENAETIGEKALSAWKIKVTPTSNGPDYSNSNNGEKATVKVGVSNTQRLANMIDDYLKPGRSGQLYQDKIISHQLFNPIKNYGTELFVDRYLSSESSTSTVTVPEKNSKSNPIASKSCYNIPVYMSVCPQGFSYLFSTGINVCYIFIEKQQFPPSCPYSNFLPFHKVSKIIEKYFNNKDVWLHAFRNTTKFSFPQFEWYENGLRYGQTIREEISNAGQVKGKNCLIFRNHSIVRVFCTEEHSSVCVYSTESLQSAHLIDTCKQNKYDDCIVADYDLEKFKCYCKITNVLQPTKYDFCNKLAEPVQPYQTELLTNYLKPDSDITCWFGLYKTASTSGMYKWLSRNEEVNYTRWAKPENCAYMDGAFKFGTSPYRGWTSETDRTLKCAICEFTIEFEEPTLQLEYIASTNEIKLRIQNLVSISKPDSLGIYCFSDFNSDDFKGPVTILFDVPHHKSTWTTAKLVKVANHPSYYWCEAFEYSSKNIIKSNTVLAYKQDNFGNEFAIIVSYKLKPFTDPFISNIHTDICSKITANIQEELLQVVRPMRAHLNENGNEMEMLMHLTTKKTKDSIQAISKIILEVINSTDPYLKVINVTSCEVCISDNTTTPDNEVLVWPETKIGTTAIPSNKLCLDEHNDMLPVTRRCEGDFLYGGRWAEPVGTCLSNTTYSETTEKLFDLVNSNAPANNITNDLVQMTQENVDSEPIDVHLVSVVLERLVTEEEEDVDTDSFSTVISNVMHFNKTTLRKAQHLLNSTDKILSALDNFMFKENPLLLVLPRLIVQITDMQVSNVRGLAVFSEASEVDDFRSYKIDQLYTNTSFDTLLVHDNLDSAILISKNALNDRREEEFAFNQATKLIIMLFHNDFLFNEPENVNVVQQSKTKIISVSVPGYDGQLESPIRMAFKMPNKYLNIKNCSRWLYGLDQFMVSAHGQWKTDDLSQEQTNLLETCDFSHMTHFGILLQNDPKEVPYNETALNILTIIGSALSLIGIIPIYITAIIFKSWRSRPGNIILINFCIAITLQIILLFSSNAIKQDGVGCELIGASLQYLVLSEFCWMFVVALLQHRRFVMVFKPQEETIVAKCLVVGWVFPLIPVIITISVSLENYKMNAYGFCNVEGNYYIFGYMLPIILILCSNAFIFIKIIYSVSRQNTETCMQRSRNYKLEILLGLFLYFVLGMTWIFGIIGAFGGGVWSTYIFCATATLRGLVLFLFFIAGNKETRLMWKKRSTYYMEKSLRKRQSVPSSNVTTVSSE